MNRYSFNKLLVYLMVVALLGGCTTDLVVTQHETESRVDLAAQKTYNWARDSKLSDVDPVAGHNRVFDQLVRHTINTALTEKGYVLTDSPNADFSIDYRIGVIEEVVASDAAYSQSQNDPAINPYGLTWKLGENGRYEGLESPPEELIFLRRGRLHIGAFAPDQSLVWHVSAERLMSSQKTDAEHNQIIREVVEEIIKDFPARK